MCSSKDPPRWWRDCRAKQNPFRTCSHVLSALRRTAAEVEEKDEEEEKEKKGKEKKSPLETIASRRRAKRLCKSL